MLETTLQIVTPPNAEPVSVPLAKQHCRIDSNVDDTLIASYITVARTMAEAYLSRALLTQTLLWTIRPLLPIRPAIHQLWGELRLPRAPAQSLTSVTVLDRLGNTTTITPASLPIVPPAVLTGYIADLTIEPAILRIGPSTLLAGGLPLRSTPLDNAQVQFVAGYQAPANISGPILQAILLLVGFLYENRGDVGAEMPKAAEWLLNPYRMSWVG